jgi:mitochondrial fission protein ELM1
LKIDNPKIWSLTDGSEGMISQTKGLAFELSNDVKELKTDIIFPWSKLQPGILPIYKWIFKNKIPNNIPDIIISCGRKSVYLSIFLKKKFKKIINIHIQNPKISSNYFSYIIAPNHDNFKGKNVINSIGALHYFKNEKKKFDINNKNLVSCIIGGENNHYLFTLKEANNLCNKIIDLKTKNINLDFLVITSRRTSKDIKNLIKNKLDSISKLWLGEGKNPYEFALYNSSFFIITSDSTSMISEASISGMPIYVYQLPHKRKSIRFNRFHNEFKKLNIIRDFPSTNILENWSYDKLDESKRIAGIIKERIIEGVNESR